MSKSKTQKIKRANPTLKQKLDYSVVFLDDPQVVLFQGQQSVRPGQVQLMSFGGLTEKLFGRKLKDLKTEWQKVSAQVKEMIESVIPEIPKGFGFESIEVSLGFSAEGKLVFIAEAGVEASVTLTFKRIESTK